MGDALTAFGKRCRQIRAIRLLSMLDQSESTGISVTEIASIESGEIYPTQDYVRNFSNWLALDPAEQANLLTSRPRRDNVIEFRINTPNHGGKNMRLFRKLSKVRPSDIGTTLRGPGWKDD